MDPAQLTIATSDPFNNLPTAKLNRTGPPLRFDFPGYPGYLETSKYLQYKNAARDLESHIFTPSWEHKLEVKIQRALTYSKQIFQKEESWGMKFQWCCKYIADEISNSTGQILTPYEVWEHIEVLHVWLKDEPKWQKLMPKDLPDNFGNDRKAMDFLGPESKFPSGVESAGESYPEHILVASPAAGVSTNVERAKDGDLNPLLGTGASSASHPERFLPMLPNLGRTYTVPPAKIVQRKPFLGSVTLSRETGEYYTNYGSHVSRPDGFSQFVHPANDESFCGIANPLLVKSLPHILIQLNDLSVQRMPVILPPILTPRMESFELPTAITDSGYGSSFHRKSVQSNQNAQTHYENTANLESANRSQRETMNLLFILNNESLGEEAGCTQDANEDGSVYSAASSLADSTRDAYVNAVSKEISKAIDQSVTKGEVVEQVCSALPKLLKALSSSIGNGAKSQMHLDVMFFVRKYRRVIAESCRDILSERPSLGNDRDKSEGMTLGEKMSRWQIDEETPVTEMPLINITERLEEVSSDTESEHGLPETSLPGLEFYRDLVQSGLAYAKLLSGIHAECETQATEPNTLAEISEGISKMLPISPRFSRRRAPERFIFMFNVDWDPIAFLREQEYSEDRETSLANAVVLTGSITSSQALTCTEYLEQTWPSTGTQIFRLIQDLVRVGFPRTSSTMLPDDTRVDVSLEASDDQQRSYIRILVDALPSWIVEIGEILAWIGSALRSSPHEDRPAFCKPFIVHHETFNTRSTADYECAIKFITNDQTQQEPGNGNCWQTLFKNPVVAEGYPIARRSVPTAGLEIPLSLMALLTGTSHIHPYAGRLYLKGFSAMLMSVEANSGFLLWHLISSNDGSRVSYNEGGCMSSSTTEHYDLQKSRHILGWCSTAKFLAGSSEACYRIETSNLPRASAGCLLEGASISLGRMGSEEKSSFSIGQKDPRVRNVRRHYIQKLKWIERKHFLLWDERDKRGWLVNGTSALLHLVQASLELDTTGTFSTGVLYDRFKMHYPDPHQPSSASRTLVHKSNTKLPIYDDDEPVRFEEHVVQFYEVLEKIFDYQSAAKNARSDSGTTRSRLEGWDFESLAAGRDPIFAREAKLDPAGMSWIDLIRSIEAITLLGRGFGDLIQPLTPCSRWDQVPRGKSYLTVCHEDLKEIGASWCGNLDSHPASLTDQISWHIPEDKSAIHGYDATKDSSHTDIVQVLLPSTLATPITTHSQLRTTNHTGAFIFGLNSANPWYWPETGQPSRQPVKDRFGTVENITRTVSRDSGVGSSLASSNPTRDSTDPTFRPSSPSQSRNLVSITERLTVDDYTIGIICALPIELRAVRSIFDSYHDGVFVSSTDTNAYAFGRMAQHNIVGVCLPQGDYGINSAADVASNLKRTFRFMQSCLLVGIGGGAPSTKNDIRLGDVVVSKPVGSNVGVLQYDMVKTLENGQIELNGHLQPPPRFLRSVTSLMLSDPRLSKSPLADYLLQIKEADEEYGHPGEGKDNLYYPHYSHVKGEHDTCDKCDISQVQQRSKRSTNQPHIHYGLIASGNQVMKDAKTRDDLARRHQVLCFEMEAAGVMKVVPSLIIRGICDYSDSHKSKEWQNYAAATAAAFAKHLLSHVPPGVDSENLSISMDMSTKFEGEEMFGVREARRETLNVEHGAKRRRI